MRVTATQRAEEAVRLVRASGRRDLVMVLGTGCCDSTAPFLYDRNYYPGPGAVEVGRVAGAPVFVQGWLAKLYGEDGSLVVDVDEDVVADSFSLETEHGRRFTLRLPTRERPGPLPG
ncbi:MAG TPA: DUF779 domain-containing protein [Actinomycetota bacterium]|nr:DUF779 domain-containing protein [Actinomycetota bacterium]